MSTLRAPTPALDPVLAPEQLSAVRALVLCDVRSGPSAKGDYARGHLPGAIFIELEHELSAASGDAACGGRHPLPDPRTFAARLGVWGIDRESHVVAYDDQNGANAAARLWWMLRALGHERVQVLDGGLKAAVAAGLTLTSEAPVVEAAPPYPGATWCWPTADIDAVERARNAPAQVLLDVRAAHRYRGEQEPIDPVAGHIPGARNLPLTENLAADGRFKTAAELRQLYSELLEGRDPERLIVHCGSGVTACHTLLALERAGLPGASLYVGSWSEWCRNPERPRAP
jgi:thiosulfate/3-mercaptopyruvate sulfurtransferase